MLILFDVGNTNIKIGLADLNKVKKIYRLKTATSKTADEYYLLLKGLISCDEVKGIVISSVVPSLTTTLEELALRYFNVNPIIFGQGIKTGLMIKADNPKEVGADLIADCIGSFDYGDKVLVIDLGTANKFIYVENKVFKGCIITPGVENSLNSLVSSTALLPKVEIKAPKKVLGNNTITCMQSGITYGNAAMIDGFIERIKQEVNVADLKVVATGGLAKSIIPLCKSEIVVDEFLTLKGLLEVYKKNIE